MKTLSSMRPLLGPASALGTAMLLVAGPSIHAASFDYVNGELIACFRAEGAAADLVVKVGPAADFEGLPLGTVIPITNLTTAQLEAAFPSLAGLSWSVLGAARGNTNFPQYPLQTVWATSPSPAVEVPGPVWKRQGQFTQGPQASQIEAIGLGAVTYGSQQPAGPNNSATGVVVTSGDPNSYTTLMTTAGNLAGTFPGNVENTTPAEFNLGAGTSRSLLYQLLPAAGAVLGTPGRLLGYFDLLLDGTLTFTAGPPRARIVTVKREGDISTIGVQTLPSFSYRVRFMDTALLSTPIPQWTAGSDIVPGDGAVHFFRLTNTSTTQFYVVEALP